EERSLQHGILEARDVETLTLQAVEAEVGDELRPPGFQSCPRFFLDEEAFLAVEQEDRGATRCFRHAACDRNPASGRHIGSVMVPSWSVRSTLGGRPRASRPDASEAMNCAPAAACSISGDGRLWPSDGSNR